MPPQVFLGAAANPFTPPYDYRPLHLAKKVAAGAQFIQTQYCYDMPLLERFMAKVREQGLHEKCFILVGVGPLATARGARWMRANVPGIHMPDPVIDRLEGAKDQKLEGKKICIELIQQIREIEGRGRRPCDGLSPGRARLGHHHLIRYHAKTARPRRAAKERTG